MEEEMEEELKQKPQTVEKKPTKRAKLDKKRKIEEYLDQHLPLNVPPFSNGTKFSNPNQISDTEKSLQRHSD